MGVRIVQNNFVSGEIAPELWGRDDLKAYFQGAAQIKNFIPRRTGGLRKRPGSNVLYELTAVTNQLGNQFFAFPYLYDSTSSGIVYLYAVGTEGQSTALNIYSGFIALASSTVYPISPARLTISAALNIRSLSELASVRAKQIGDTLFFTRNRKAAFKCAVTFNTSTPAASTISFSMMTQTAAPLAPDDLTATSYHFISETRITPDYTTGVHYKDDFGYQASQRKYALYGVKNGVFSPPKIATANMVMPWTAGAYIDVSFSPRWDLYDRYVLGKLNGAQYGILGEFYPKKEDELQPLAFDHAEPRQYEKNPTFRNHIDGSGFKYLVAPNEAGTGPTGVTAKLTGEPNDLSADSVDVALSKYASIYLSTAYTVDDESIHGVILPQCVFPFSQADGFQGGRARICLGGSVRQSNGQSVFTAIYAGMALRVTPFNYTAAGVTWYPAQNLTVVAGVAGGYVDVLLPLWNGSTGIKDTFGPAEASPHTVGADGCVRHIGFKVEYVTPALGARKDWIDEGLVLNGIAFDTNTTGAFGTPIANTAYDSFVFALDDTAPEAAYSTSILYSTTEITCAWNENTGTEFVGIDTQARYDSFIEDELVTVASSNGSFHKNSMIVKGSIFFTWEGGSPAALMIWPNAIMQHSDGSPASAPPLSASTITLYQLGSDNVTWHQLGTWPAKVGYWAGPATLAIPTTISGKNEFKIAFSDQTVFRGLALAGEGKRLVYKDDNIASGSITGIQEKLTVGDSGMDCRVMDIWEQRLVMASSDALPFTVWFSAVGDLYNFNANRPQVDSDAFSATIAATKASKILHIVSEKRLIFFTESGEFVCDAAGAGFSSRTISIKRISSVGIHPDVEPVQTEDRMVFVAHDGRSVYEMRYDLAQDSVIPVDRSVLAFHLTENATIIKAAYQRFPDSVVWFLLSDGTLLSMTFMPEQEVIAWARHSIAQPANFTGTLKLVDIFSTGAVTTGSGMEPTSELMMKFEVYSGSPLARQSHTYLERMRPHICQDSPALDAARCSDHVGLANPPDVAAKLITLRPESPDLNTQGLTKCVGDVCLRVRRTHTFTIRPSVAGMNAMSKSVGVTGATNVSLFSGDVKILPRGYFGPDGQLEIASTNAMPCEILSLVCKLEVSPP